MRLWDISPPLSPNTPAFPGDTVYTQRWNARIGPGCPVNVSAITMSPHLGAHADAPLHYGHAASAIGDVDLEPFLGPCRVIHAIDRGALITPEHLAHASHGLPPRVLVRTCVNAPAQWSPAFSAFAPETIAWLAGRGVRLVGIDSQSVDPADSKTLDSHQQLLIHDMRVLENLVLDDVAAGDYELIALPLKLIGADASPVRAVLRSLSPSPPAFAEATAGQASPQAPGPQRGSRAGVEALKPSTMITKTACLERDAADPLAPLRKQFALERLDEQGVIYLDGNSLGVLPKATAERVREVVEDEWGVGLIRSWNTTAGLSRARSAESRGWIDLSRKIGDKIARLVGAGPGEVVVADSTSVNLYKVLSAAIALATKGLASPKPSADAGRRRILSERANFPTDLYIADTLARAHGLELLLLDADEVAAHLDDRLAILLLTHVNYRTGRMHRMAEVTQRAHDAGAIMIWDLAHSAGAVPVDLHGGGAIGQAADFAVGCGYKYLNGGPGAPAFAWAHPRHTSWMDCEGWRQPLSGWLGHAAPFEFTPDYRPAAGMSRFICGTPPVLSLAALECGVDTVLAANDHGGLAAVRNKSIALTELFIELVESRCARHGLALVTPRDADVRGSQVAFAHATGGYAIMQALIARGVIGDFRAPNILRFGFTPLYTRFVDVWDAVDRLEQVLVSGEWRDPRFHLRAPVT